MVGGAHLTADGPTMAPVRKGRYVGLVVNSPGDLPVSSGWRAMVLGEHAQGEIDHREDAADHG